MILLNLDKIYGAIAYYLAHRTTVDSYLAHQRDKWTEDKRNAPPLPTGLREKLMRARQDLQPTRRS